jgi:hypothetical protein
MAKSNEKNKTFEISKVTVGQLCLVIGLIILILPALMTLTALCKFFVLDGYGEIGDVIGGVTAPFINGIAAILVFVAFKEQVKANVLITEQQHFQHIQEQVHRLEGGDVFDLPTLMDGIEKNINDSKEQKEHYTDPSIEDFKSTGQKSYHVNPIYVNQATYIAAVFQHTISLVSRLKTNKRFMQRKLIVLYEFRYKILFAYLQDTLSKCSDLECKSKESVITLLKEIRGLENSVDESIENTVAGSHMKATSGGASVAESKKPH